MKLHKSGKIAPKRSRVVGASEDQYWDVSWSPVRGCSHASPGCANCWAERLARRFATSKVFGDYPVGDPRNAAPFAGFADANGWTGRVELIESELAKPLHWRKPRVVALNWMGDMFHESLPDHVIERIFAVMSSCPLHKFLVLTKRAKRMHEWFSGLTRERMVEGIWAAPTARGYSGVWPLPNVALGVSCENQKTANERIAKLLQTPAAMRWISVEPLLGHVDIGPFVGIKPRKLSADWHGPTLTRGIDWVIVGGESGPNARPMHPDWVRSVRDQCAAAGVPFWFKGWGEWLPGNQFGADGDKPTAANTGCRTWGVIDSTGKWFERTTASDSELGEVYVYCVGKRDAGRMLDGREHLGFPARARQARYDSPALQAEHH